MIILDTNVVSELMRPEPAPMITAWIGKHATPSLFLTTITKAELRFDIEIMAPGKRREHLVASLERMLQTGFARRILPFDSGAARAYAVVAATRRRLGRPIAQADAQTAAIARVRRMVIATRNVQDFKYAAVDTVNPWLPN